MQKVTLKPETESKSFKKNDFKCFNVQLFSVALATSTTLGLLSCTYEKSCIREA